MKILGTAKRVFDKIIRWCAVLSTICIVVIMITNVLDTVMRWLSIPIYGIYELNSMLVGLSVFLGLALTQQLQKHIKVTILTNMLPVKFKQVVAVIVYSVGVVFFAWLAYWYGIKAYESFVHSEVIAGLIKYPAFPLKAAMCLGLVLLTIQQIIDVIMEVRKLVSKPGLESEVSSL